jgi:hypothetical protein
MDNFITLPDYLLRAINHLETFQESQSEVGGESLFELDEASIFRNVFLTGMFPYKIIICSCLCCIILISSLNFTIQFKKRFSCLSNIKELNSFNFVDGLVSQINIHSLMQENLLISLKQRIPEMCME